MFVLKELNGMEIVVSHVLEEKFGNLSLVVFVQQATSFSEQDVIK